MYTIALNILPNRINDYNILKEKIIQTSFNYFEVDLTDSLENLDDAVLLTIMKSGESKYYYTLEDAITAIDELIEGDTNGITNS